MLTPVREIRPLETLGTDEEGGLSSGGDRKRRARFEAKLPEGLAKELYAVAAFASSDRHDKFPRFLKSWSGPSPEYVELAEGEDEHLILIALLDFAAQSKNYQRWRASARAQDRSRKMLERENESLPKEDRERLEFLSQDPQGLS